MTTATNLSASRLRRNGLLPGEHAPHFELADVAGRNFTLAEFKGRKLLLVFSDTDCGPCNVLAPQLERLSRRTPDIKVLMISRDPTSALSEKIREHELTFPVVVQRQWEVSLKYALFATPSAYLIDENGLIATPAALGVDPILTTLRVAAIRSLLEEPL